MALGAVAASDEGELFCWHNGHRVQAHVPDVIALRTKGVERLRSTGGVQLQADKERGLTGRCRLADGPRLTGWQLEEDADTTVLEIALAEALCDRFDSVTERNCMNVDVTQDDVVDAGAYPAQPRPDFRWLIGEADVSLADGVIRPGCGDPHRREGSPAEKNTKGCSHKGGRMRPNKQTASFAARNLQPGTLLDNPSRARG